MFFDRGMNVCKWQSQYFHNITYYTVLTLIYCIYIYILYIYYTYYIIYIYIYILYYIYIRILYIHMYNIIYIYIFNIYINHATFYRAGPGPALQVLSTAAWPAAVSQVSAVSWGTTSAAGVDGSVPRSQLSEPMGGREGWEGDWGGRGYVQKLTPPYFPKRTILWNSLLDGLGTLMICVCEGEFWGWKLKTQQDRDFGRSWVVAAHHIFDP